ncbi:MAG: zinc-ribbon domain-containing protein [Oscillospiraceae bacterium]|jgi:uncharacterized membrane protein|nr:zinc-ribbon domain-containing protein [Oscillospiraceae bacterium]
MAFCKNCGANIADGTTICPNCGKSLSDVATGGIDLSDKVKEFTNTPDFTGSLDAADISANKGYAILAYFGILVLIPIFAAKHSRYARFHANQGLMLIIANVVVEILLLVPIVQFFAGVLSVVLFVFMIIGIVNAASGKAKGLPLIGAITLIK